MVAFACVGILAFGNLPGYTTIFDALVLLFGSALGEYNLTIYDDLGDDKKFIGICFHVVFLSCNLLLLLNLVIAIMSDTYQSYSGVKLGLYSQEIIEAIPMYKNDK